MSEIKTAIGLMSGTSMDGIDVALIRTDGETQVERGNSAFFPYARDMREAIEQALVDAKAISTDRSERPGVTAEVEQQITSAHSAAVSAFLAQEELTPSDIDVIGFHGQTVLHRPQDGLTVQLGSGVSLAQETGTSVVYDMRANDMIHRGQGAPLIPVYHQALARQLSNDVTENAGVAFVNIGGISNVTYINGSTLIAFDTGPGNALIDQWVQQEVGISYDQGGMIAAEGEVDQTLLDTYLADPFFEKPVPKSLDRHDFQLPEVGEVSVETVTRTLACLAAQAVLRAVDHLPTTPKQWIICGGGRHNPHIMRDLEVGASKLGSEVITAEMAGFDGDGMEAEAWGYLAVRSMRNLPLTYPQTTGCSDPVSGGVTADASEAAR